MITKYSAGTKELDRVWTLKTHDIHLDCRRLKRSLTPFHKVTKEANNNQIHTY